MTDPLEVCARELNRAADRIEELETEVQVLTEERDAALYARDSALAQAPR